SSGNFHYKCTCVIQVRMLVCDVTTIVQPNKEQAMTVDQVRYAHRFTVSRQRPWLVCMVGLLWSGGTVHAFEFDTGNPDLAVRWDNSLRYAYANRVQSQDAAILRSPNNDDGDRNFNKGTVLN